jgi:hypothetical protein
LRHAWYILATEQMSQFGQLLGPGKLVKDAAQVDQQVDVGCRHEARPLRLQVSQPGENVRFAMQLIECAHLGMTGAKPRQELAYGAAEVTNRIGMKRSTKGFDSLVEAFG